MRLTIASTYPSNDPEIHKAGCADVKRGLRNRKYQDSYDLDVETVEAAAAEYWSDIIAESDTMTNENAIDYVKVLPCVNRA